MARTKKPRDLKEMVDQLETQLNLLEEDATKAFDEGRKEYLPEVATKLRILVARFGSNKPLLFEVAKRFGIEQTVKLGGPPVPPRPGEAKAGDVISLDAFFDRRVFSWGTDKMTARELIRGWCEQLGGAHADWSVDDALLNALHPPIVISGLQPSERQLRTFARITLHHGRELLELVRKKLESEDGGP